MSHMTERATFAAGCFWGVEERFRRVRGVTATRVGYTGGTTTSPDYREVCTGRTGHAEAVEVRFDPSVVSYEQLLEVLWRVHDPTTPGRQGPDVGDQYRSAIFYHDEAQRAAAIASKDSLQASGAFEGRRIVTEVAPAAEFHLAEEYHQRYLEKRGRLGCRT